MLASNADMKTLARDSDKVELHRRLREVRPDSVARWGRMTAHQMVCHLADALRLGTGDIPARSTSNPLKRTVIKWLAFYAPVPWPPGIPTSMEIDQVAGAGTQPSEFAADVAQVDALLDRVTAASLRLNGAPHPFFGVLSTAEWLRWGYLHVDHHLRQFGA
jgi:Protein of unknown function (DUF1569)